MAEEKRRRAVVRRDGMVVGDGDCLVMLSTCSSSPWSEKIVKTNRQEQG